MPVFSTRCLQVGSLSLGGDAPIRIQSMTNTDTMDTKATVDQSMRLFDAGCELVRITAPGEAEARNLEHIREQLCQRNYTLPLVADIHFQPRAAEIAAALVQKVRINPGNYVSRAHRQTVFSESEIREEHQKMSDRLETLVATCKRHATVLRIGVNHGSLSERITAQYGNTALGMAESAMEFVRILHAMDFDQLVLSMKSSHLATMTEATRLLVAKQQAEGFDYPIHLGVTEAGNGEDGRIKSAIGIGSLLLEGIGNTIRVSLTEDPEKEIPVAQAILQACGRRIYAAEFIACPSCGRTQYDIQKALADVQAQTRHLKGLKIAVMGCVVNGPGEMADADYGYVGAGNAKVFLYRKKEVVQKNVDEHCAVQALVDLIKADGRWIDA